MSCRDVQRPLEDPGLKTTVKQVRNVEKGKNKDPCLAPRTFVAANELASLAVLQRSGLGPQGAPRKQLLDSLEGSVSINGSWIKYGFNNCHIVFKRRLDFQLAALNISASVFITNCKSSNVKGEPLGPPTAAIPVPEGCVRAARLSCPQDGDEGATARRLTRRHLLFPFDPDSVSPPWRSCSVPEMCS